MLEYKTHTHKNRSCEEECEMLVFNPLHKGLLSDGWYCVVHCTKFCSVNIRKSVVFFSLLIALMMQLR
jgi:hypothetical protein